MSELQTVRAVDEDTAATASAIALPVVLVADADAASRGRRARQLAKRGFRVLAARTPFEAIVKASCHLPDVIVVADSLGEGNVESTTTLLETCPATTHIPIVRLESGRRLPLRLPCVRRM
jgi:CheY-like chemotaxis protein